MRIRRESERERTIFMPAGAIIKGRSQKEGKQRRFYPDPRTPGAEWECERNKMKGKKRTKPQNEVIRSAGASRPLS
jgi:hypothetical protein